MSQIVLFYTLPESKLDDLLDAAEPKTKQIEKGFLVFKSTTQETVDGFWDFLKTYATEQETFQYSALGFLDLDLILMDKSKMIFSFGDKEISEKLSNLRNSSIAVLNKNSANQVLDMMSGVSIESPDIKGYFRDSNRPFEELGQEAILAAFDHAKKWFKSINNGEIGLLIYS